MWYWLCKFEGMLLILPFRAYYALRGIPFFTRCRKCQRRLFDQQYLRLGICENCTRQMALCEPLKFYQEESLTKPRRVSPGQEHLYKRLTKKLRNGRVLDVGCNDGYLLSKLHSPKLYGMDISPGAISIAKNCLRDCSFCLGDCRGVPFRLNTFDCLICTEVLEHIEGNDAIRECYRVLKPNGIALITVPNGKGVGGKYFPYHIRLFSFSSIISALEEVGFEIISGQKFGLYIPFVTRFLSIISQALSKNLPFSPILNIKVPEFLAASFLIECRKPHERKDEDSASQIAN